MIKSIQHKLQRRDVSKVIVAKPGARNFSKPPIKNERRRSAVVNKKPSANIISKYHRPSVLRPGTNSAHREGATKIKSRGLGNILVMVACGPSVLEVPIDKLNHHKIKMMTINKPDKRIWPTDYWTFCDHSQYIRNKAEFESYNGMIFNSGAVKAQHKNQIVFPNLRNQKFSINLLEGIDVGRSSTYSAMQIALWMGFDKIYIFGCDMCEVGGKLWHYGTNPDIKSSSERLRRFREEAKCYDRAANTLSQDQRGKFYFCSKYNPFEFVEKFNKRDHESVVDEILLEANKLENKDG